MSNDTAYGYGSVYQRAADGLWVGAVEEPRERGQKRRRRMFSGRTREEVEAKLAAYRSMVPARPDSVDRGRLMAEARGRGTHSALEWWTLVREVRGACFYCGVVSEDFEKDHKVPVSRGGSDRIDNIVVSCATCNRTKGTMTAEEYIAMREALAVVSETTR